MRYTDEQIFDTLRQPTGILTESHVDKLYSVDVPARQVYIKLINIPEDVYDVIVENQSRVMMSYKIEFEVSSWGIQRMLLTLEEVGEFTLDYLVIGAEGEEGVIDSETIEPAANLATTISFTELPASALSFNWIFTVDYSTNTVTSINAKNK